MSGMIMVRYGCDDDGDDDDDGYEDDSGGERAVQKEKRENEIKGDLIICELCSQPRSRANVSRHRRNCKGKQANVDTGNRTADS